MSDIFISYARPDRPKAEQLARLLEQQGWTVWWDRDIAAGSKYAEVIAGELAGAKAVITLWSRTSVTSNWVKDEAQEGAGRGVLIPALIDKISLPLGFRQFQAVDLSDWDGSLSDEHLQDLLRGVAGFIGKPLSVSTDTSTKKFRRARRIWLYLIAGVVLVSLLGIAEFFVISHRNSDTDQREGNVGGGTVSNANSASATTCSLESRHTAADLTGKGLTYIDPGGNHDAAVLQFNEAIAECPDYAEAYFYRGQSYAVLRKNDKAIEDFRRVLQLSSDRDTDSQAQKFIAALGGSSPTPQTTNTSTSNTTIVMTNSTAGNTGNSNRSGSNTSTNTSTPNSNTSHTGAARVQVADIFATDKATRIAATTRLVIESKGDASAVRQALQSALAHPENKSGVINTLVYLENVDPAILKQFRPEIEKLLAVAAQNGPQTADLIKKVQSLLNS